MRIWLLGLTIGLLGLAFPALPVIAWAQQVAIVVAGCLLTLARRGLLVAGMLLGFVWGAHVNQTLLAARLPECVTAAEQDLLVKIVGQPVVLNSAGSDRSVRFRVLVLDEEAPNTRSPHPTGPRVSECSVAGGVQLRLTWYRPPAGASLQRGQRWRIRARVKPPWGYQNPGGFDFERWLLSERLQGTGYVRSGALLQAAQPSGLETYRNLLRQRLFAGDLSSGGVLFALVSGDGSGLQAEQWARFRATGTIHLMVVSGLHVGLVAGFGFLFGGWLVRLLPPLLLWLPARRAGALSGIVVAGCFVGFSGAGVPGIRAWCMAAMAFAAVMTGRRIRSWDVLLAALAVVLVVDPLSVHQQGFWLSFCAVLALMLFFTGLHDTGAVWRGFCATQVVLLIGVTPMLATLYGQLPAIGVLANLLVVPVMSAIVIPLALLAALLLPGAPDLAGFGFYLADQVLRALFGLLDALAVFPMLNMTARPALAALGLICAAALLRGGPWRLQLLLGMLWMCWCLPRDIELPEAEFRITALDVGQGSAILVDTRNHRLLFDAGPAYPSGFDLGAAVVLPSIVATGARRLDTMVVSHSDMDHRGGMASVLGGVNVARIFESRPARVRSGISQACVAGVGWQWDGVTFKFLSPAMDARAANDNDGSCVLEISNARERALLPGDISQSVERTLLRETRPVRLLFAPHHGSNSSSSNAFVRLLNPDVVFVSAGKGNRYHHPHAAVVGRYRAIAARLHVTGLAGALVWDSQKPLAVETYRHDRGAYWTTGR
jgi:competence protein ComEC